MVIMHYFLVIYFRVTVYPAGEGGWGMVGSTGADMFSDVKGNNFI